MNIWYGKMKKTNQIGFIMSGMFRLSHIDADANEWIVGYSFVNDFVCDYPSFYKTGNFYGQYTGYYRM